MCLCRLTFTWVDGRFSACHLFWYAVTWPLQCSLKEEARGLTDTLMSQFISSPCTEKCTFLEISVATLLYSAHLVRSLGLRLRSVDPLNCSVRLLNLKVNGNKTNPRRCVHNVNVLIRKNIRMLLRVIIRHERMLVSFVTQHIHSVCCLYFSGVPNTWCSRNKWKQVLLLGCDNS